MTKFYLYIILMISSFSALLLYELGMKNGDYANELFNFALIGIPASVGALFDFILENRDRLKLAVQCFLFKRNDDIYVSLSYLLRIKLRGENKYLMIRGNKLKGQYQPIGGVYKKYDSLGEKWHRWGAREEKNDMENSDDLRFRAKRKFIPEIRKWFFQRKNREVDVWREFCEEAVQSGILPKEEFNHIKPEFLYSVEESLIFRKGKDIHQFLIYDIFQVNLTQEQEQVLRNLFQSAAVTHEYAFVDEPDLSKELFTFNNQEHQLGFHARYLIHNQ